MKFDRAQIEKALAGLKRQASALAQDKANLVAMVDAAKQKARENKKHLDKAASDLTLLLGLLKAYALDRYEEASWKSIVLGVAAVIYFLNPFDLLPDFLVGGFVDDGLVLSWVLKAISEEVDHFRSWKSKKTVSSKKKKKRTKP